MNVMIDLPAEARARLETEATRRGITLDQLVAEIARTFPADTDDPLEAFIGCGASGRTEPFDIHRERAALATKTFADGI